MTVAPPRTKPSTPRLSEVAQHVVAPSGVVATGWPAVREKCGDLGLSFRPWQHGAGQLILAKRASGKYAATIGGTGLSIPRQVGKTFLVGAIIFALCLLQPKLTVIWTSHRLRTSEETFTKMQAFARRKRIAPFVEKVTLGSGEEEIRFRNGSRILFGARERGFGRGFDEVDVLIFDEAQILTDNALDDMIPATNQSRQPTGALLLFMGTPPKPTDPGEVFRRMRTEALSGEDVDTGWIEFGADAKFSPTPAPAPLASEDWRQVAKANPSFPADTPREAILRMRKKLGPESFLREGLGIWDDAGLGVFPAGTWAACVDAESTIHAVPMYGIDTSNDRAFSTISACGAREDGALHLETVLNRPGTEWVVAEMGRIAREHGGSAVVDPASPAGTLIDDLKNAGVRVWTVTARDYAQACGWLFDAVKNCEVRRLGEHELTNAERNTKKRTLAGGFAWDRKNTDADITPLVAVTLACWGFRTYGGSVLDSVW